MHFRERHCIDPEDASVGEGAGGHGSYFVEKNASLLGNNWGQIFVAYGRREEGHFALATRLCESNPT